MCGMVCCDSDGRLNDASIKLLGSRTYAQAVTVRVDVTHIKKFSFFPGQILAIRASNPRGKSLSQHPPDVISSTSPGDSLKAQQVISSLPQLPRRLPLLQETHQHAEACHRTPFSVLIVSGPYSSSEDLSYEPLNEIAALVTQSSFDLVILIGPFVDVQHPIIQSGDMPNACQQIAKEQVNPLFSKIAQSCGDLVIVPSVRDARRIPVFPQQPLHDWLPKVSWQPNPTTFTCSTSTIQAPSPSVQSCSRWCHVWRMQSRCDQGIEHFHERKGATV